MTVTLLRTDKELKEIYDRNFDSIYRISYMYMNNQSDAEDIVQNVFLRLIKKNKFFDNLEHEKRWLILVTINTCKNHYKTWWNRNILYEEVEFSSFDKKDETIDFILTMPKKYKYLIYLYYYEGYTTKDIAKLLQRNENTVRSDLSRARELLKKIMKEECYEK